MNTPERQPTIKALDGVRALACLLVVIGHAGYQGFFPILSGIATFGVMLFFTLSGFLMAYHYHPEKFSARYWVSFLAHRFIRVYPAFCIAIFGYLILREHLPTSFPFGDGQPALSELKKGWFLLDGRGIFWTVPVEIKFYFIYPLFATFIAMTNRRNIALPAFAALILGVALLKLFAFQQSGTLTHIMTFLSGIMAAMLLRRTQDFKLRGVLLWTIIAAGLLLCLYLFVAYYTRIVPTNSQMWGYALYLAPLIGLFFVTIERAHGVLVFFFSNRVMRWIGKISYSIYLMHFFVITAARIYIPHMFHTIQVVLILTAITSVIFYFIVERPFTQLAKITGRKIRETWPENPQAA